MPDKNPNINTTTRLPRAKGENTLYLLKSALVNTILGAVEAFLNTRYFIQQTDGKNILPALEAKVVTTELGRSVTFPPISSQPAGRSTRYFNGSGAPGAGTLSSETNYISTSSMASPSGPDFYFDLTNAAAPDMWVCVTAGTNSTSVWTAITGDVSALAVWA